MHKNLRSLLTREAVFRLTVMFIGNVIVGLGIAVFRYSRMGNDPFTGVNLAVSARTGIPFQVFQILINLCYFAIQLARGRKLIGPGTIVNAFLLGTFVDFFYWILSARFGKLTALPVQFVCVLVGMVITSFGLSLYQRSDTGVAPYDSLALMLDRDLPKVPYFWCRMFTDGLCALVCFLAGGIIGPGTLVSAFGFGPVIHFFDRHFSEKLFAKHCPQKTVRKG